MSEMNYESHQQRLNKLAKIVFEYLLVISPDEVTSASLSGIKNIFKIRYGCEYAASLIPHITLINFVQFEMNEKRIVEYFERFSKSITPFDVQLNGFGQFPPQTIFVNVSTKAPIVKIVNDMQTKFSKLLQPTERERPKFIKNPHLTIARQMLESQHSKAWEEWRAEEYVSTFRASEMSLLRRKITGGKCQTIATLQFGGDGTSDVQLTLPL